MMVNPGDPRSPYRQVADALRAEIESGVLRPGDPIPSNVMIMDRFKVASSTAQRAVRTLTSGGSCRECSWPRRLRPQEAAVAGGVVAVSVGSAGG
jgi:DNA-binding transcriptional MocR family regulator